jgi:preprotein translocase subunit SecY
MHAEVCDIKFSHCVVIRYRIVTKISHYVVTYMSADQCIENERNNWIENCNFVENIRHNSIFTVSLAYLSATKFRE